MSGSTLSVDGDVAADAGAELRLERGDLVVVERMGGGDFGGGLAAMVGGEAAEGADDRREARAMRPFWASTPRKLVVIGSSAERAARARRTPCRRPRG